MAESIYPGGAIRQQCETCTYVVVWKPKQHKHERIDISDLRTVPFNLIENPMNNIIADKNPEGTQHAA